MVCLWNAVGGELRLGMASEGFEGQEEALPAAGLPLQHGAHTTAGRGRGFTWSIILQEFQNAGEKHLETLVFPQWAEFPLKSGCRVRSHLRIPAGIKHFSPSLPGDRERLCLAEGAQVSTPRFATSTPC